MGTSDGNGDVDIVQRLASGDPAARNRLATHYAGILRAVAHTRAPGRSRHFLEDVVNETLVRVLAAVQGDQIRDRAHFASFCIGVCERVVRELGRKEGQFPPDGDRGAEGRAPDNPEAEAARNQALAAAEEALASLPGRDRAVFEQVLLREEDKDQVCRQYGISRPHLRVLLHRARERFTEAFEQRMARGRRQSTSGD